MFDVDLKSMKEIKGMSLAFIVYFWGLKLIEFLTAMWERKKDKRKE